MSAVIAIVFMLAIVAGVIGFSIVNALRLKRHLNQSLHTVRTRLEDDANSLLEGLLNQPHERAPRSANGSQSAASD